MSPLLLLLLLLYTLCVRRYVIIICTVLKSLLLFSWLSCTRPSIVRGRMIPGPARHPGFYPSPRDGRELPLRGGGARSYTSRRSKNLWTRFFHFRSSPTPHPRFPRWWHVVYLYFSPIRRVIIPPPPLQLSAFPALSLSSSPPYHACARSASSRSNFFAASARIIFIVFWPLYRVTRITVTGQVINI